MSALPLTGVRVLELCWVWSGPLVGQLLADLGAEVIKVEPPAGDNTRRLLGSGAGFYPLFNRNKKSLVLDLHTPEGHEAALRLIATADVLVGGQVLVVGHPVPFELGRDHGRDGRSYRRVMIAPTAAIRSTPS